MHGKCKQNYGTEKIEINSVELRLPRSLKQAYYDLLQEYKNNKTVPTLAYMSDELHNAAENYLKEFLDLFVDLEDGMYLCPEQENALLLGTLIAGRNEDEVLFTPFHPLNIVTHRLTPEMDNTFWVNLLGRGYPFPRKKLRWCTDRLKIQPVNKFVKEKIAEHGEIILVIGTRKAESARRAKTMAYYEKKRVRELLSPNPSMANELVFSPLENWNDNDVWVFLMQYRNPWGYSNTDLLTLYKGATADNECPMMVEKGLPSCGKSRFGCWVCTMVEKDKSMEAMIANDEEKGK